MLWKFAFITILVLIYISSTCGQSPFISSLFRNRLRRKQNRQFVAVNKTPYLADIERANTTSKIYMCTGSIISEFFVLTTGSCVDKISVNEIGIRVGSNKAAMGGILKVAEKKIMHPWLYETKHAPLTHDLALLKMQTQIQWTADVASVPIGTDILRPNSGVSILGWDFGQNINNDDNDDEEYSDLSSLKHLKGTILEKDTCQKEYNEIVEIKSWMMCVKYSVGTCFEANGALLVYNGKLYGVRIPRIPVLANGCSKPDIFYKLRSTVVWINFVTKNE